MQDRNVKWWDLDNNESHKRLFGAVRTIYLNSRERIDRNLRCLQLYGNRDLAGLGPMSYTVMNEASLPENRVKMNLVSSMADTACARISKLAPDVQFLTSGGNYVSQRNAKELTQFIGGMFYENEVKRLHQGCFRDSTIFDIGVVMHYVEDGRVKSERVFPLELIVDPFDGLYGKPRTMYRMKYVSRSVLLKLYPEQAEMIRRCRDEIDTVIRSEDQMEEYVVCVEAWRLPSVKGGSDGRHVICIGNATLFDEDYKKDYHPFTVMRWSDPVIGYYGQSLADRLTPIQIEVNKMLRVIQRSFHLGSSFKVFLEAGSSVSKEHVNNDVGSIIFYRGKEPIYYTPQTVHPEFFSHLKFLQQSAYEETGISQLSASSKVPAGIDGGSGRAMREYNNIESERFAIISQAFEHSFLHTAKIYIDLSADAAKEDPTFGVRSQSKNFVEHIKWKDVAPVDDDSFIMQMFPVSSLPNEPAGRLATVQELITSGMVSAEYGASLLNFPDLKSYTDSQQAIQDDMLWTLDQLIEGRPLAPEPFQDPSKLISFFQNAYLRARRDDVPEDKLENIRRFIAQAVAMLNASTPPQQQPQPSQQQPAQ